VRNEEIGEGISFADAGWIFSIVIEPISYHPDTSGHFHSVSLIQCPDEIGSNPGCFHLVLMSLSVSMLQYSVHNRCQPYICIIVP
jgi:hypothetical protein